MHIYLNHTLFDLHLCILPYQFQEIALLNTILVKPNSKILFNVFKIKIVNSRDVLKVIKRKLLILGTF